MAVSPSSGSRLGRPVASLPSPSVTAPGPPEPPSPIQLRDVTSATGIAFRHTDGSSGRYYIQETMSGGVATLDYDGDGLVDIYFPNGAALPGARIDPPPRHALYKNLGAWRFRDATLEAGVACTGYGMGAAAGDCDNDGHPDLYVSISGPKVLYRNHGDGTFRDATAQAGVANGNKIGAGVSFLDADGDGHLDLYVANYVKFSFDTHFVRTTMGVPSYPGPAEYEGEAGTLYLNRGDGTFRDASQEAGVARPEGRGMGMTCADYDQDGDTDVFVCNDFQENFLFRNDGRGHFDEVGVLAGVAYDAFGTPHANMGVDFGDYDNDGLGDFYVTAYRGELATLFRNLGGGLFTDVTHSIGSAPATFHHVTWGCAWVDFDNDGHRDLFIACGHTEDNIEQWDKTGSYEACPILLRNTGDGKFVNVSNRSGDGLRVKSVGRGAAFEDLDNDGDVDAVVFNSRRPPTVLQNMLRESGSPHHWLQVRLQGVKTNRDGVGARVRVVAGDSTQVDEVHGGRGYQSHWGSRLHFGLGPRTRADRLEVHWIGGGVDVLEDVAAGQLITITEGMTRPDPRAGWPR